MNLALGQGGMAIAYCKVHDTILFVSKRKPRVCLKSLPIQLTRAHTVRLRHGRWRWETTRIDGKLRAGKWQQKIFQVYYDTFQTNLTGLMSGVGVGKIK